MSSRPIRVLIAEEDARGIKRCSPGTRVLVLSAQGDRETVLEMLEAGAGGYLVKGSPVETILTSIERAANGQGSLSVEVTGGVIEELAGLPHARRRNEDRSRRREERIRHALDDDVVHAVFQPICTLAGSTVGAEALPRFHGPPARGPYGQGYFFARPAPLPLPLLVGATSADADAVA